MAEGPEIIIADHDRERIQTNAAHLERHGFQVRTVENGAALLEACREAAPKVAVVEAFLPRKNGFEVLKALKEDEGTSGVRVVILLDEGDSYGENRARLCGADAILTRPFSTEDLVERVRAAGREKDLLEHPLDEEGGTPSTRGLRGVLDSLEERARVENPLAEHITDPLTGLYNAAYTALKLADEVKKVRRFYHPLTCVMVGIDEKPGLDDEAAAQEMRAVINEIAGILLCESRDIDHLARSSAREFVCLLPHTDTPGGVAMAERILKTITDREFTATGVEGTLTASAGISTFTGTGMEAAEDLLTRAREALRTSVQWGGNRCTVWTPDQAHQPG